MANEAEVDIVVNAAGALPDLERQLQRIVDSAQSSAPEVGLEAGLNARNTLRTLDSALSRVVSAAEADPSNTIDLTAVLDQRRTIRELDASIGRAVAAVQNGAPEVTVEARLDRGSLATLRTGIGAVITTLNNTIPPVEVEVQVDRDWEGRVNALGSALLRMGRSAGSAAGSVAPLVGRVGALGGAVGALVPAAAALAAAIQQIAPAAAVAASGMLTMRLAAATLKLAMVGVEDAVTAAFDPDTKPEELQKALEKLAPEARKFVVELRGMRGELRRVQQGVQNRFFKDFDQVLSRLAQKTGPQIERSLNKAADSFNAMGREAATAAIKLSDRGVLGQALGGANKALQNLEKVPARAVTSFGLLAAASSPALDRITKAVDAASLRIAEKLDKAFKSGELERLIDKAVDTFAQIFRVVGNFASGVGNIFGGLTQDGGGLFDTLEKLSGAFENLTASEEFQSVLKELALTVGSLVEAILPLFTEALKILAPAIEAIAPAFREFIEQIAPYLVEFLQRAAPLVLELAEIFAAALPDAAKITIALLEVLGIVLAGLAILIDRVVVPSFRFFRNELIGPMKDSFDQFVVNTVTKAPTVAASLEKMALNSVSAIQRMALSFTVSGIQGIERLRQAVEGAAADIIGYFVNLGRRIYEIVSGFAGQLYSAGQDLIAGLINGITSMIPNVLGIARGIANSVVSTIKGALDIQSPSRVMMKVGEDTARGLIVGLDSMVPTLKAQVNAIANILPPGVSDNGGLGRVGVQQQVSPSQPSLRPINVFVGEKQFDSYIDSRAGRVYNRGRRTYATGLRY